MVIKVKAIYEDGVLKLDDPLPFKEHEQVTVRIESLSQTLRAGRIRQSAGILDAPRDSKALEYLLGPENSPLENS